jgi:hypothetical protein
MKQKLFVFILILLVSFSSLYGQKKYRPGYIITNDYDTVRGLINLRSNHQNSLTCRFRGDNDRNPVDYSPSDIKGFRIENSKFYLSKNVVIDSASKRVFLEYLVRGIVNLYYLKDLNGEYFFVEKEGKLVPLTNKESIVTIAKSDDNTGINDHVRSYSVNSGQYKGALRYLFQESPAVMEKIPNTEFNYKALVGITKDYHNSVCKDYKCIDYFKSTRSELSIEPYTGLMASRMELRTSKDFATNLMPLAGFQLRYKSYKGFSMWSLFTGLSYSHNNFQGDYDNGLFEYPTTYTLNTKYSVLRLPLGIERCFTMNRIQPLLSLSYENIFILNPEYDVIRINYMYGPSREKSYFRKYQFGFSGGAGLKFNMKKNSFLVLKCEAEYRIPSVNLGWILDNHRVYSVLLRIGYGFKIR